MPLVTIILVFGFIRTAWYVRPSQDAMRSVCLYSYTHQFFADVYEECLDAKSKSQISLSQFRALTEGILLDAQVVSISAKNNGFTYYTRYLGSFTETKTIPWVIEDGQWKIHWKWDLLLNGFQPGYHVVTAIQNGNRGAIIDTMGKTLVDDTDGYVISVDPSHIDSKREQQMLKILSSISSIEKVRLQNAYSENPRPGKAIPLFSTFEPLTPENEKALRSYPGVTITPYRSRLYMGKVGSGDIKNTTYSECCTRIYSSLNYHGIGGPDYTFDAVLSGYDGGTLSIVNEKGETVHTIIQKAPKNGSDVTLPL